MDTGGISESVWLEQRNSNVIVDFGRYSTFPNESARWQIHELPVDTSIDPKFRCRPDLVGRMMYNDSFGKSITNVNINSLVMHSIVLLVEDSEVTCGTIGLEYGYDMSATVDFRSGVFGRMQLVESSWSGEKTTYT